MTDDDDDGSTASSLLVFGLCLSRVFHFHPKNHNLCNDDAKTTTHLIVFKGNQLNKTQPFSSVKATLQN